MVETLNQPGSRRLVADVGGTNTRIAVFDPKSRQFGALQTYDNRDFACFEDVLKAWYDRLDQPPPTEACIAIAAGPSDDLVHMTNIDWSFSCSHIARQFDLHRFSWVNDFVAVAHSLPFLAQSEKQQLYSGDSPPQGRLAALGPGTGLGGATLEQRGDIYYATACEPGYMGLSPCSELEYDIFRLLAGQHSEIFNELLVSGPGLQRIYRAVCELRGLVPSLASPQEISGAAIRGNNLEAHEALSVFCALLGSVCGDFVLANGAYRGLYLAGGILPGIVSFLQRSEFQQRFCNKSAMKPYLEQMPIWLITAEQPGLIGAAHAPLL